jgi:hypothetical protein
MEVHSANLNDKNEFFLTDNTFEGRCKNLKIRI